MGEKNKYEQVQCFEPNITKCMQQLLIKDHVKGKNLHTHTHTHTLLKYVQMLFNMLFSSYMLWRPISSPGIGLSLIIHPNNLIQFRDR